MLSTRRKTRSSRRAPMPRASKRVASCPQSFSMMRFKSSGSPTGCPERVNGDRNRHIKWALLAGRMKAEADLGWLETVETAKVASTRPIMPRVLPSHIVQALPRPTHRMSRGGAASWKGPRVVRPRLGLAHAAGAVSARRPFEPPPTGFDDIFDLSLQARDNQVVERNIELARIR
jgi:hypothetical protein